MVVGGSRLCQSRRGVIGDASAECCYGLVEVLVRVQLSVCVIIDLRVDIAGARRFRWMGICTCSSSAVLQSLPNSPQNVIFIKPCPGGSSR